MRSKNDVVPTLTRMAFFSCSASARNWSSSFMMTLDLRGRRGRGPENKTWFAIRYVFFHKLIDCCNQNNTLFAFIWQNFLSDHLLKLRMLADKNCQMKTCRMNSFFFAYRSRALYQLKANIQTGVGRGRGPLPLPSVVFTDRTREIFGCLGRIRIQEGRVFLRLK